MDNKITTIKERILLLIEYKNLTKESFFKNLGMSYGNFKGEAKKRPLNSDTIANIFTIVPDVNPQWLLLGKEPMLINKEENKEIYKEVFPKVHKKSTQKGVKNYQDNTIPNVHFLENRENSHKNIPLVEPEAVGGFGSSTFTINKTDIIDTYDIADFSNASFLIRVRGDSMSPRYKSGDMVACTILKESQFIQWNEIHIIATQEQGVLIKRLKEGENDTLICISENSEYPPFNIPKSEITGLALVLGGITLE